ncbi:MAG: tyrosine-protein phosphatase [Patescibacteria group bacterium]|nr:tyrosine-protein phosphatase [Patescibacteria group bacterium]
MKWPVRRWLTGWTLAAVLAGCIQLPKRPAAPFGGIAHFGYVTPEIYRGGQPTPAGFDYLKKLGVRTVVKLDTDAQGNDAYAESIGMTVTRIPITTWQQVFGPVPVNQIDQAARELPAGSYIHCQHGQDRTGLFVYRYRRLHGWSKADAERELLSNGFHRVLHGLWECVEKDRN